MPNNSAITESNIWDDNKHNFFFIEDILISEDKENTPLESWM